MGKKGGPQGMKAKEAGRRSATAVITVVNSSVNILVLTVIVLLISFAGYALWDSNQIHQAADKSNYAVYKPSGEDEG